MHNSRHAMSLGVKGEVIGSWKATSAVVARERPISRVFAAVSSQFVGPRELPSAAWPLTRVRFLAFTDRHLHSLQYRLLTEITINTRTRFTVLINFYRVTLYKRGICYGCVYVCQSVRLFIQLKLRRSTKTAVYTRRPPRRRTS